MKDLLDKDKAELYELRKAGLKRQVGSAWLHCLSLPSLFPMSILSVSS